MRPRRPLARACDVVVAALALALAAPVLLLAALAIRLVSPGPVLYRARRLGLGGRPFVMFKLRTMHADGGGAPITGPGDPRVFPLGRWLRRAKIDELPQLLNVLAGDMALIGPRPEEPAIVAQAYGPVHRVTLEVPPGLTSPGSLFQTTDGDALLDPADPVGSYVARLLPLKISLDVVYVRRASLGYDLRLMGRTAWTLGTLLLGRRRFPPPPELPEARRILATAGMSSARTSTAGAR